MGSEIGKVQFHSLFADSCTVTNQNLAACFIDVLWKETDVLHQFGMWWNISLLWLRFTQRLMSLWRYEMPRLSYVLLEKRIKIPLRIGMHIQTSRLPIMLMPSEALWNTRQITQLHSDIERRDQWSQIAFVNDERIM